MNISNQLTFLRIFLTFICILFILLHTLISLIIAFFIFLLASFTDFLDGFLARRKRIVSDLGKIIDPLADKILIIGVFSAFLQLDVVNVWMLVAIMLREFIITGLRIYALNKGVVLAASKSGKHKTFSQITGIIIIFIILIFLKAYPNSSAAGFLYYRFIPLVLWYIVFITIFSGIHYFWSNRKLIKTF